MNFLIFILFTSLVFLYLFKKYKRFKQNFSSLPPFIRGKFLFGNYFDIDCNKPHLCLTSLGENYQDAFCISIFGQLMVVLNSRQSILELLCSKTLECAGRPSSFLIQLATNNFKDLAFSQPNIQWLQARTAFHKFFTDMKKLHDRKDFSEIVFLEEWPSLYFRIEDSAFKNETFNSKDFIYEFQSKIISTILFGEQISSDLQILHEIRCLDTKAKSIISSLYKVLLNKNPFECLFDSFALNMLCKTLRLQKNLMNKIFEFCFSKFRNSIQSNESTTICVRSIIDLFQSLLSSERPVFNETHMKNILTELVFAGVDSVVNTVNCFLLYMSLNLEIQNKVFEELKEIKSDFVGLNSKKNLAFTEACILETLRLVSQIPLGIFRKTLMQIDYLNYKIPEGTILIANLWKLHHDPNIYPEPFEFKPQRFLDENGKVLDCLNERLRCLLPFGGGKRVCPGKSLALNLIYLYVTNLVKNFEFSLEGECSGDPRKFVLRSNLEPGDFRLKASSRKSASVTSLNMSKKKSEIRTLCTDRASLIQSIRENKLNLSDDEST